MIWTLVFALIQKESYAEIMNKGSYSKIYEDVITLLTNIIIRALYQT